jgi:hypothetical protein
MDTFLLQKIILFLERQKFRRRNNTNRDVLFYENFHINVIGITKIPMNIITGPGRLSKGENTL